MSSKNTILLDFNSSGSNKIKHLAIHPKRQWIGIINANNTYSLWNYRQKILIKSFSCSSLDDGKSFDAKQSMFYDRFTLPIRSPVSQIRNNIIFFTTQRVYFYDYCTDVIKLISEKQLQQKNIRKVAIYSQTKICIVLNDGSFKVLDIRGLYSKDSQSEATIRTFKGYHTKPISWIFAYSQNINETPRVITVSASDGLMACWNVDSMLLQRQSLEICTPCFKFIMHKGSKNDSNNGQEILSLQYDTSSYHLVTLTESYVTIWSTMTGSEIKRVKNNLKLQQLVFFNHFSYGSSCFLAFSQGSNLIAVKQTETLEEIDQINLKEYVKSPQMSILKIKNNPENPTNLFIITTTDLIIMEIGKFYTPVFGFHPSFLTKLTTFNQKNFIHKSQAEIRSPILPQQLQKIQYPSDVLINIFYLSFQSSWICFNLVEIQFKSMFHEHHKLKKQKVSASSLLNNNQSGQTVIMINFDGSALILFNKNTSYFQVYKVQNEESDLIGRQRSQVIDFWSNLKLVYSGFGRNVVWHQYKDQFSFIGGLGKNGELIVYENQKQKKGFFGKSKGSGPKLSGEVNTWHLFILDRIKSKNQYKVVISGPPIKTKIYSLFNMGCQYGYSQQKLQNQCLQFVSSDKNSIKQIEGSVPSPSRFFISYCESYQIYCYDGYFLIYRVQQNGCLTYFQSIQHTILDGYFWQKLFFFTTKEGIYFLQIQQTAILIRIAYWSPPLYNSDNKLFQDLSNQDLEPYCYLMPEGQLQIIAIINMNLMVINQSAAITFLNLRQFPYIEFCIEISSGFYQKSGNLFSSSGQNLKNLMKETLSHYGLILSDILV